jgi:AbrB family looped-hinge helix DNA binding protein
VRVFCVVFLCIRGKSDVGKEHMRITSKGQVTIPRKIREKVGFLPNTEVEFSIEGEDLKLKKKNPGDKGEKLIRQLTSKEFLKMTTDEIMALTRGE